MQLFVFFRSAMGNDETVSISSSNEEGAKKVFVKLCEKTAGKKLNKQECLEGWQIFTASRKEGVVMVSPSFKPVPEFYRTFSEMGEIISDGMKKGILTGEYA